MSTSPGQESPAMAVCPPAPESLGSPEESHRRVVGDTVRGVFYFAGGQTALFVAGAIGGVFLARLLSPSDFGVYAITSFLVVKVSTLAELGLGTNVIHDRRPVGIRELRSLFTVHSTVAVAVFLALFLLAPTLASVFRFPDRSGAFVRAVALMILIEPLSAIPVAVLSRALRYDHLAKAEVISGCVYQVAAVALAFRGFSYWSFAVAALLSTASRALILNIWARWRVGFAWDTAYIRRCVRFGGAFQLSSFTAVLRDNIITLLGGPLFGPTAVGLLNWADRLSWLCSQTYVGICAKVAFPTLSRIRDDARLFAAGLTKMLRYVNLATMLTLSIAVALGHEIVHFVFTDKWLPALPFFYCFALRLFGGNYTTILDLALKAQGRPQRSLKIVSMWTVWEWGLALIAVFFFGYAGIALSYAVGIWFALIWLYRELSAERRPDMWRASRTPVVCGVAVLLTLTTLKGAHISSLAGLALAAFIGVLIYGAVGVALEGTTLLREMLADLMLIRGAPGDTQEYRDHAAPVAVASGGK
jgi:O-antigen/teichoic acid export membrane protein